MSSRKQVSRSKWVAGRGLHRSTIEALERRWLLFAPVAQDDLFAVDEDSVLSGDLLADNGNGRDLDADGDALTTSLESGPANGSVTVNANGTFSYRPAADFWGSDSFGYRVSDGGSSDSGLVTVTVRPINDPPTPIDFERTVLEDSGPLRIVVVTDDVRGNDDDGNPAELVRLHELGPAVGTAVANFVVVNYTPAPNFSGQDQFTFTLIDGDGQTGTGTITINVTGVNDAPEAFDDSFSGQQDVAVSGNLLSDNGHGADRDVDGDPLTINTLPVSGPTNGTVQLQGSGAFIYTPHGNFSGTDSFVYRLSDGALTDTAQATVVINGRPNAQDDDLSVDEDRSLSGNVMANNANGIDSDPNGDPLTVSLVANPTHGQLTLASDGTFTYTPSANFNGSDAFQYQLADGRGATDTATARVTVNPVNDSPLAADDGFSTNEDTSVSGNLLNDNGNGPDSDLDGDALFLAAAAVSGPTNGTVSISLNGSFTYTPASNFGGTDTFTYEVLDGRGGRDLGQVTIRVATRNDPPTLRDDAITTNEDQLVAGNVLANNGNGADSDPDGDTITVSSDPVSGPGHGELSLSGNGAFTYTPNENFNGIDSFVYAASDGNGGSRTAIVTIQVNPQNDRPIAVQDSFTTAQGVALQGNVLGNNGHGADFDVDNDPLTVELTPVLAPSNGTIDLHGDGTFTYTPNASFHGTDSFVYRLHDGQGGNSTATASIRVIANPSGNPLSFLSASNSSPAGELRVGQTVTVNATFEDLSVTGSPTARVNWGDGSAVESLSLTSPGQVQGLHTYGAAGDYRILLSLDNADGDQASIVTQAKISGPATPPATVVQVVLNAGVAVFDRLTSVTLGFSSNVGASIEARDLKITSLSTNRPIDTGAAVVTWSTAERKATWNLSGIPFPVDRYTLSLSAVDVRDPLGQSLDGDADGNPGGEFARQLIVTWAGDTDFDLDVDFEDFLRLSSRFNATDADWSQGDSNGDGKVDFGDFLRLSSNFGKRPLIPVSAPAAGEPPAALVAAAIAGEDDHHQAFDAAFTPEDDWLY